MICKNPKWQNSWNAVGPWNFHERAVDEHREQWSQYQLPAALNALALDKPSTFPCQHRVHHRRTNEPKHKKSFSSGNWRRKREVPALPLFPWSLDPSSPPRQKQYHDVIHHDRKGRSVWFLGSDHQHHIHHWANSITQLLNDEHECACQMGVKSQGDPLCQGDHVGRGKFEGLLERQAAVCAVPADVVFEDSQVLRKKVRNNHRVLIKEVLTRALR